MALQWQVRRMSSKKWNTFNMFQLSLSPLHPLSFFSSHHEPWYLQHDFFLASCLLFSVLGMFFYRLLFWLCWSACVCVSFLFFLFVCSAKTCAYNSLFNILAVLIISQHPLQRTKNIFLHRHKCPYHQQQHYSTTPTMTTPLPLPPPKVTPTKHLHLTPRCVFLGWWQLQQVAWIKEASLSPHTKPQSSQYTPLPAFALCLFLGHMCAVVDEFFFFILLLSHLFVHIKKKKQQKNTFHDKLSLQLIYTSLQVYCNSLTIHNTVIVENNFFSNPHASDGYSMNMHAVRKKKKSVWKIE